jgi:hypothetical protein
VKSEDSDRIVTVDQATADVLKAWRKAQLTERLAWSEAWTDCGRVYTRENGMALRPGWEPAPKHGPPGRERRLGDLIPYGSCPVKRSGLAFWDVVSADGGHAGWPAGRGLRAWVAELVRWWG